VQHYPVSRYNFRQTLNHYSEYSSGIRGRITQITVPVPKPCNPQTLLGGGNPEVDQNHHDNGEEEVNPEKRGAFLDVRDRGS